MASHPLYGKKKKKLKSCPNPLFEQWLTEWKEAAVEKGAKSQYTYGKALNTLKKFPLELHSGKDCKILENFGDKICKMLDDRLAEHITMYGTCTTPDTDSVPSPPRVCKPSTSTVAKPASRNRHGGNYQDDVRIRHHAAVPAPIHELSDSEEEEVPVQPARKRQKSGQRSGEREYIPAYRSGPYAIMLTLYKDMQSDNSHGYMTKEVLCRQAQPLADKSFTMPDPGCRYTAWSAMGTLVKKGLVIKESSPARYSLTDAGCGLAHKLEAVKQVDCGDNDNVPFRVHATPPVPAPAQLVSHGQPRLPSLASDERSSVFGAAVDDIDRERSTGLRFWYVTDDGQDVLEKDKAMVTIDVDLGVGFLVKCNYAELLQSELKYKLDTSRILGDDYVHVYLSNNDTVDLATPPVVCALSKPNIKKSSITENDPCLNKKKSKAEVSKKNTFTKTVKHKVPQLLPLIQSAMNKNSFVSSISHTSSSPTKASSLLNKNTRQEVVITDSEESSLDSLPSVESSRDGLITSRNTTGSVLKSSVQRSVDCVTKDSSLMDRIARKCDKSVSQFGGISQDSQENSQSSQASVKTISSISSAGSMSTLLSADFVLQPGQFEIVLCVDNAEFYGASKGSSKSLLPDLIKNGVNCDLRKLHVGDILWVAKEKIKPLPGQLAPPQGRELVLNYIVERKRMDDLVGSCIDGRFKEQKFRLKKCGLQHPMYLIEDYGSIQHFSMPESSIKQAITNTQVIDGFQVKRTKGTKETVAFLTVFTRYLQSCFKGKILYAGSLDSIKESSVVYNVDDKEQILPAFEEFNQSSVKSKALTVQEMLGKQFIQLHGMSAEKARAVIDKYPTLTSLFRAYDRCITEREKESMLASIKCGKAVRNLGQAQSKQIYQLYNTRSALT